MRNLLALPPTGLSPVVSRRCTCFSHLCWLLRISLRKQSRKQQREQRSRHLPNGKMDQSRIWERHRRRIFGTDIRSSQHRGKRRRNGEQALRSRRDQEIDHDSDKDSQGTSPPETTENDL